MEYKDKVLYDADHSAETCYIVHSRNGEIHVFESPSDAKILGEREGYDPRLAIWVSAVLKGE